MKKKNVLMKLFAALVFTLCTSSQILAQKVSDVSKKELLAFTANKDIRMLIDKAKQEGFVLNGTIDKDGTKKITGKDEDGDFEIYMIVFTLSNKEKETFEVVQLVNVNKKETKIWGESDGQFINIKDSKQVLKPQEKSNRRLLDCFEIFSKGAANCKKCLDCLKECGKKNKVWKQIACAAWSCTSDCIGCVTNVYKFLNVYFNPFKNFNYETDIIINWHSLLCC